MAFADWLRYSISVLVVIKMTAASWHFRNACEKDLDKVFNDQQIHTKTIRLFALDSYA